MNHGITVIVITRNEEKNIERCLKSVGWCDEVIVIDDRSIDDTVTIAKKAGAKVILHDLQGDFSKQKNFAMSQATYDWILYIDADEEVTPKLQEEIRNELLLSNNYQAYTLRRIDFLWGKELKYGEVRKKEFIRLARKDYGKWIGSVHEVLEGQGKTKTLQNPLLHFPHPTLSDFLKEINFYSSIRAKELYDQKVSSSGVDIVGYPIMKFMVTYILKMGFLDGVQGILLSIIMSFYSFLVRGKLFFLHHGK